MTLPPNLRINPQFPFPATVQGSGPVVIAKAGGIWSVSLNYAQISSLSPGFDPSTKLVLVYDQVSASFLQTTLSAVVAAALANTQSFGRNIVGRNGSFEVAQRGATVAAPAGAQTYTMDGWYVDSVTTTTAAWTVTQVAGIVSDSAHSAKVQRNNAQTGTGLVTFGFPLDTDELLKLRGNQVVLSFSVKPGANWSPASGTLSFQLEVSSAAGPAKRGHTPYTSEVIALSGAVNLTASGATTRVVSSISTTIATNITQAELTFLWTPVGTAGADDSVTFDDVQLEVVTLGASLAYANPLFERTDLVWDTERCQRFAYAYPEAASGVAQFSGAATAATTVEVSFYFPVSMRAAPTLLQVGTAIAGGTTYKANDAGVLQNVSAMATKVANTPQGASLTFTSASLTAGHAVTIEGLGGGAIPFWSAEI